MPAPHAHVPPIARSPSMSGYATPLTSEPMRPPQPIQVVEAILVFGESAVRVGPVPRIILARCRRCHTDDIRLLR